MFPFQFDKNLPHAPENARLNPVIVNFTATGGARLPASRNKGIFIWFPAREYARPTKPTH
jgi:hypothetical protein